MLKTCNVKQRGANGMNQPSPKTCTQGGQTLVWLCLKFFSIQSSISHFMEIKCHEENAYYVPTTLLVLASIRLPPKILAVPKSDIFGFISSSSNTLLAFISLWMILSRESSCRYRRPFAIPLTMFVRLAQSSSIHFFGSAL